MTFPIATVGFSKVSNVQSAYAQCKIYNAYRYCYTYVVLVFTELGV